MSANRIPALRDWLDNGRVVLREAKQLEADGCYYLLQVYLDRQPDRTDITLEMAAIIGDENI